MTQFFTNPERESDPYALPDAEVFYFNGAPGDLMTEDGEPLEAGWYYWFCFPGCMPDSDPFGPYKSEKEAIEAAREDCAE